jgi:hypothetical protein
VKSLKVDCKIVFMENNWVMLLVDIDIGKGTFQLHFELVIGDALKITVIASLQEGLPEAVQDRVQEIEDGKTSTGPQNQSLVKQADQNLVNQQLANIPLGGQLEGKTFKIHVEVDEHIVKYLVQPANDHLGGERDPAEEGRLDASLSALKAALDAAKLKYDQAKAQSDTTIDKTTKGLDARLAEMKQNITTEQINKAAEVAKLDQEERNMVLQAAQDERDLAASEATAAAAADEAARKAHVDVEEWRVRVYALQTADKAVEAVSQVQDAADAQLAATQIALTRLVAKEPGGGSADPTYEAWKWQRDDLTAQVKTREQGVTKAVADVKVAKAALDNLKIGALDEENAKLKDLMEKMKQADADAQARRAAIPVNIATGAAKAAERRSDLQKRRAAFITHADQRIADLTKKQTAFEQERTDKLNTVKATNDVGKTDAGREYEVCIEKHRAADVKLRAYRLLKDSISSAGEVILTPLRFAVNVVGKALTSLLSIESFILDGSFSGKSSNVAAKVKAKVGGYEFDFGFDIDLGDIVSFFSELWNKIKEVIASVGKALLDLARQGIEAVTNFCREAANEVKKAATTTVDAFLKELAAHEKEIQEFLQDIDRTVLQPFKQAAEQVLRDIGNTINEAEKGLTQGLIEMGSRIDEFGLDQGDSFGGQVLNGLGGFGQDLIKVFGGQVAVFGASPEMNEEMRRKIMEMEAFKRQQVEERDGERNEKRARLTMEDIARGEKEIEQLRAAVIQGQTKLEQLAREGIVAKDELDRKYADIDRMMGQIKIREIQTELQRTLMKADDMRRQGAPREDMVNIQISILLLQAQTG